MNTGRLDTDVVVVGSGPGGATVARQMARAGHRVTILERGRYHRWLGNHIAALAYCDKMGFLRTEEGLNLVRGITAGGSTVVYCGSATPPPAWMKHKYGVDLDRYCEETISELRLETLPDEVIGSASMRLMEAGAEVGVEFEKLRKFIDPSKCKRRCGGTCMLGCPHGAKWTARDYLADAVASGAQVITRANVQEVASEDGVATGVLAITPQGLLDVRARVVILAAGGLGTPCILQRSGIDEAGQGMFVDPLVFVTGVSKEAGTSQGPPMGVASTQLIDEGILLSDLLDPWLMWLVMAVQGNVSKLPQIFSYRRQIGLMVKVGDERHGFLTMNERISKPLSKRDRYRLNKGAAIARRVLIRAGCDPRSIMVGPIRGAHPGATASIGQVVNENLETRIKNLYVSDASVIPEALDRPVVLTLICLGKRLAEHLQRQKSTSRDGAAARAIACGSGSRTERGVVAV